MDILEPSYNQIYFILLNTLLIGKSKKKRIGKKMTRKKKNYSSSESDSD